MTAAFFISSTHFSLRGVQRTHPTVQNISSVFPLPALTIKSFSVILKDRRKIMPDETLKKQLYHRLRTRIASGEFSNGRLPSLRTLAKQYNTSPGSIRDALQLLELKHLISAKHGRGYFILPPKEKPLSQLLILGETKYRNPFFSEIHTQICMHPDNSLMLEPAPHWNEMSKAQQLTKLNRYAELPVQAIFFPGNMLGKFTPDDIRALHAHTRMYYYLRPAPSLLQAGIPGATYDEYLIGYKGIRHLLDVGCRTLLACIPPEAEERAEGAAAALEESLISARLLFHDDSTLENSAQSDLLRAHEIDGIFFASDDHALRELPLLQSYGYRIPEDLAVLGCFDTVTRDKPESTLSSLDIRPELIINKIWGMYQEKIHEAQITVPPVLSPRASTLRFHASKHRPQPEVIRLSSRGISLHQTLDFFLPKLLELAPDAAVVLLGISDMVHPAHLKEVSQYEKDLNTLLEKLSSIRCKPVICDLYLCDESKLFERHDRNAYYGLRNPNERIRAANKIIHETTRKYGAACYRLSAQVEKHGGLNPDGEHLEESAQKILAESLAKLLHPLAPRRIVCLGDSNTFGCYGNRSYVDFLRVNLLTEGEN